MRLPGYYGLGRIGFAPNLESNLTNFVSEVSPESVFLCVLIVCRYSTFMLLYPTGISSEVGLIYIALPYMKVH